MNETSLRWKGRLGSLKPAAAVVLLLAVVFLAVSIGSLSEATNNPTVPRVGAIGELVNGAIGANRYVTVLGTALYPAAYEETEDGASSSTGVPWSMSSRAWCMAGAIGRRFAFATTTRRRSSTR